MKKRHRAKFPQLKPFSESRRCSAGEKHPGKFFSNKVISESRRCSVAEAFSESRRCCAAETQPAAEWSREDAITAYIISQAIRGGEKYRSLSDSQWPVCKGKSHNLTKRTVGVAGSL